ncbi:transposase [Anoxybacillus sp. MB8]|uniref:transposase n=1 Tax=Anoxybacillus sp. MB8 TaxID=2496850 RepID=UPI0034D006D4
MKPISALTMSCGPHGRNRPPKTSADVRPSCHVSLFGAVNIHDSETVLHQTTAANAATFLDFLRMLKERDPDRLMVLVLDNARIHHAKMVKEFLREEGQCFHFSLFATAEPDQTLMEMAERYGDGQCISQGSQRYHSSHYSVCQLHPRTSGGSAAALRVCRMTEKLTLHVACI